MLPSLGFFENKLPRLGDLGHKATLICQPLKVCSPPHQINTGLNAYF